MKNILSQIGNIQTAPPPSPIADDDDPLEVTRLRKPKVTPKKSVTCAKRGRGHREPRYRLRYSFWINVLNPMEELVADEIERLKNKRAFASAVRDGIMLISELREGKIDLLLKLFPWIRDCFTPPPTDMDAMKEELSFLKALVLAQANRPVQPAGQGAPRSLTAAPAPADDDDTLTVAVDADAGSRSAQNFIDSMLRLQ